jgi:hypothetical protein
MLKTAPSKPDRAVVTPPAPLTTSFLAGWWNLPILDYLPIRALVALIILGVCFVRAYVGMWGSRIYTPDAFAMLDGAWRIINGQRPHVDFYTGLGPVTYLITAVGVAIASGNAAGLAYGQALFGCVAGLWTYLLCERRLRGLATLLACIIVVLMVIVPTTIGDSPKGITPATTYNRCSYGLVAMLMIEAVAQCRPIRRRDEFWGGASTGLVLGLLLFLKVSFFLGGGFLLVALWPLRKQTIDRWGGISAAFALTALAFAWYLRFDLGAVYNDLRTVAHTKHVILGWYLPIDVVVSACPFLVFVHLISKSATSQWARNHIRIAGLGVCLAGFFLLMTSWQFYALPLDSIMAVLLVDRAVRTGSNWTPAPAPQLSALLLASLFALNFIGSQALALQFALSQKLRPEPYASFTSPVLSGFNSPVERHYVEEVNDGCDLLNQQRRPQDSVLSLDFTNPFSFALGMKPPSGGTTWLQYRTNFDDIHGPSPERVFGDATLVMLPKVFSDYTLPETVPRIYGPFLKQHYALVAESVYWWLYRRKGNEWPSPVQEIK